MWQRKPFIDSLDVYSVYCLPQGQVYFINEYYNYPLTEGWAMLYFCEYFNNSWMNKDSCKLEIIKGEKTKYKFGYKAMWGLTNHKLYSVSLSVSCYNGNTWNLEAWDDYWSNDIKAINENSIYAVGDHGIIRYFNGKNWYRIGKYASTTVDFKAIMPFENVIYILGYYQVDSWIIKGEVIK